MKHLLKWVMLICISFSAIAKDTGRDVADIYYAYNPPYSFYDSLIGRGIIIDLVQEAAEMSGIEYDLHTGSWSETENKAAKNPSGIFVAGTYRGDRTTIFDASHPVYMVTHRFYKKAGTPFEYSGHMVDLHGLRIGVIKGWEYKTEFMKADYLDKVGFVDTSMGLVALYSGEIDLLATDELMTEYILTHQMPTIKYEIDSAGTLDSSPIFVLVNKLMPDTLFPMRKFNIVLDKLLKDGTVDRIKEKYLHPRH